MHPSPQVPQPDQNQPLHRHVALSRRANNDSVSSNIDRLTAACIGTVALTGGAFIAYKLYKYYTKLNSNDVDSNKTINNNQSTQSTIATDNIVKPTLSRVRSTFQTTPPNDEIPVFVQRYHKYLTGHDLSTDESMSRINQAKKEAAKKFEYKCINENRFAVVRVHDHDYYHKLQSNQLKHILRKDFNQLSILDIGCCFGTDLRAMILDGASSNHVFGVDLNSEYIDIGLDILFCDRDRMQNKFAVVDVLASRIGGQSYTFDKRVQSGIDVVYCGSVYHLLDLQQQKRLTHVVSLILNANPSRNGGLFIGRTAGSTEQRPFLRSTSQQSQLRYMHSVTSFRDMLTSEGFVDVDVKVQPIDMKSKNDDPHDGNYAMFAFSARRPFTPDN